jgi:type IX secretion system PorP/SprF family membrane protein
MIMKLKHIAAAGALFISASLFAQEKTLSQYYSNRVMLNPALTGIGGTGNVGVNHRNQVNSLNMPVQTMSFSADNEHKRLGYGLLVSNQSSGDGGFKTTNALLSLAYHLPLDVSNTHVMSLGFQGGIINQNMDRSKLTFGSQYSSVFGPVLPSGETFTGGNSTALDVNTGINYSNNGTGKYRPFIGVAMFHVNKPEVKLTATESRIPQRYMANGGLTIDLENGLSLTPNVLYMSQANADFLSVGLMGRIAIDEFAGDNALNLGFNLRTNDALSFIAGATYNSLSFGFSYDVAAGNTRKQSIAQTATEFSLAYRFKKSANKKTTFPGF